MRLRRRGSIGRLVNSHPAARLSRRKVFGLKSRTPIESHWPAVQKFHQWMTNAKVWTRIAPGWDRSKPYTISACRQGPLSDGIAHRACGRITSGKNHALAVSLRRFAESKTHGLH